MNPFKTYMSRPADKRIDPDRIGIVASILCAIHCAIAPVILIFAPAFGQWWSHPATHWILALLVVPLAGTAIIRGFRKHQNRLLAVSGVCGITLILLGAALPYTAAANSSLPSSGISNSSDTLTPSDSGNVSSTLISKTQNAEAPSKTCGDTCCPTLVTDNDNNTSLNIPPASILTTAGGLALILTHVGNVCFCATCRRNHPIKDR